MRKIKKEDVAKKLSDIDDDIVSTIDDLEAIRMDIEDLKHWLKEGDL